MTDLDPGSQSFELPAQVTLPALQLARQDGGSGSFRGGGTSGVLDFGSVLQVLTTGDARTGQTTSIPGSLSALEGKQA